MGKVGLEVSVEEDVLGRDVSMDDAKGVEEGEATGNAEDDEVPHGPVEDIARCFEDRGKVAVWHVVVHEEADVWVRAGIVAPEDGEVRVLYLAQRLDLL